MREQMIFTAPSRKNDNWCARTTRRNKAIIHTSESSSTQSYNFGSDTLDIRQVCGLCPQRWSSASAVISEATVLYL